MSDTEYDSECYRKQATEITVNRFHHATPGSGEFGQTRPAGVVSNGLPNARASQQATFRGKELMRRANTR